MRFSFGSAVHKHRWVRKFLVVVPLLATFAAAQAQPPSSIPPAPASTAADSGNREIYIDVGRAGSRKLRIAIPTFGVAAGSTVAGIAPDERQSYTDRLSEILAFTGSLEFIPQSGFLSKPDATNKQVVFEEWTPINTEALIFGKFDGVPGGKPSLELRLYDVTKRKLLLGKRWTIMDKKGIDAILRRFADLCVQAWTGELGIFSTKIAFVATQKLGEPKQVYIANFDGSGLQKITDNNAINMSPSWSPDGTKLTYTSFKDGKAEIYLYNLITKKTGRLTRSTGNNSGANWHPNGKTIAFSGSGEGKTSIYTMNSLDGGGRASFISGSGLEVEPAYAPDGGRIAFASGRFGNPHIFVRDLGTGNDTRITFAGWYNSSPSWRPDGKKIAFAGYDREIDRYDIFIVNPDGRQLERLTLDTGDNEKPTWSPDGRFIMFQSNRLTTGRGKQRGYKIMIMSRDGENQRALSIPYADVAMPSWGPRSNEFLD